MAASNMLHESPDQLTARIIDEHRAITSMIEKLEAIDWHNQRAHASKDAQLQAILMHNRDEEIEHACKTPEWIRRNMTIFDATLRSYLFSKGDITAVEENANTEEVDAPEQRELTGRHRIGHMKASHE